MPIYDIESPDGKVFQIEGPEPPTQQEMEELFSDDSGSELGEIVEGFKEFGPELLEGAKQIPGALKSFFSNEGKLSFDKPKAAMTNLYQDWKIKREKQTELLTSAFDHSLTRTEQQEAFDEHADITNDASKTVVDVLSFGIKKTPEYLATRAAKFVALRKQGVPAKEATKRILAETLMYGTFKVGGKIFGTVREGAKGIRVNPVNGEQQVLVKINPKSKNIKDLFRRVTTGENVSVREKLIYQAVIENQKTSGKSMAEFLNKPFKGWLDVNAVKQPIKPTALLEQRAKIVDRKIDALTKRVDLTKANSVKDIKGQLIAKDPLINKLRTVTKTGKIRQPTRVQQLAMAKREQLIENSAETIWNAPQTALIKQNSMPNSFKKNMKTSSIGEIGSMGIIKGSREGLQNAVAGFERNVMTPESFFSALDGNQTTAKLANQGLSAGPYVENFWLPAKQLFKQRVVLKEDFGASKEVILSKFPQKYKQLSDTFDGKTFTYQEKIYALALSKNSDSLSRLMNSGFTISILDQMKKSIGILPGHDVVENPVVQSVFQYFHKGRPLVEGAIKDLTGETPDLPEFYAPMYNAVNRGNPSFDSKEIHALKDLTGTKAKPSTSRLKSIKKGVKLRLDLDLEKGMDRYADEVSRYPMIPYHNRAMKLLGQSSPSLSDEYSPFVVKNIREWLNDVTVGSPSTFGEFDKVIDKGRLLGYGFILSKNPFKIGAIQAASAFNAADLIGYSEFGEALSDIVANPQISDIIRKESPLMRTRFAHLEQQERALQTNTGISGPKNFLTKAERAYVKALGIPTSAVDKAMAGAGYLGSKRKWARLHPKSSNIDQINYAEDVVGNTQPMTQDLYRPSLTRRNVLGKTIAAFHTQRNQVASQQISTNNAYRNGKIGKIEWAKTHINQSLMPPLYLTLVSLAFTPPAKRNIKKATDFSIAYGKRVLGTLPLFSTWLGTLEYGKGKMRIPGFKPFEFVGENILKIMKDPELISALALSFESFMAMRGVNLQVPKNIAAVVKTAMEGDVDLQRLIKSGSETGDPLTTMERFKKGKRERSSNLRKRKAKMKRTLDDQINDILQL